MGRHCRSRGESLAASSIKPYSPDSRADRRRFAYASLSAAMPRVRWVTIRRVFWSVLVAWGVIVLLSTELLPADSRAQAQSSGSTVSVVHLDRPIDGVSERYLLRELERAEDMYAELVVITLDTPGGFLDNTRVMVRAILESAVPVAVYVYPTGAHAASAGTFIAAAAHILAMAPVTDIGAASVVGAQGEDLGETLQSKANEDAAALLRSIAEERGRNVEALEDTVFDAKAYSEAEALENGISDLVARDLDELFDWADGRVVEVRGREIALDLENVLVEQQSFSVLDRILSVVANPNLAFLLISLGGLALIVELWTIGTWIPGTIGVALLIIGFAGIGQLPFHWAGLALIALAMGLFALELLLAPGIGFFGVAGVIALILGGVFLFPSFDAPDLPGASVAIDIWMLATIGVLLLIFMIWLIRELRLTVKSEPYISPGSSTTVVGMTGSATTALSPIGEVYVAGERWTARSEGDVTIEAGDAVLVVRVDGVTLVVRAKGAGEDG